MEIDVVEKRSMNRVKKAINDHIMRNYRTLFTNARVTKTDITTNHKLLQLAETEISFSNEPETLPVDLLSECLKEL